MTNTTPRPKQSPELRPRRSRDVKRIWRGAGSGLSLKQWAHIFVKRADLSDPTLYARRNLVNAWFVAKSGAR